MASSFPASVAVGNQNIAASLLLTNVNSAPDAALTVCNVGDVGACSDAGAEGITLLPSCGAQNFTLLCTGFDPNVFNVDPSATGATGTDCAHMPFSVTGTSVPKGIVTFKPLGGVNVVLPSPGRRVASTSRSTC